METIIYQRAHILSHLTPNESKTRAALFYRKLLAKKALAILQFNWSAVRLSFFSGSLQSSPCHFARLEK